MIDRIELLSIYLTSDHRVSFCRVTEVLVFLRTGHAVIPELRARIGFGVLTLQIENFRD